MSYTPRHRLETGPSRSKALYLLPLAGLAVTAVTGTGFSSAAYTASSITTSTVTAASDWTPPTVALQAPAAFVRGDVALTATASDAEAGIRDVLLQYRPAGTATWTTICTDPTSPFGCTWSTAGLTTGTYELQAVATDRTGLMTTTPVVTTTVDNTAPVVTLADPGSPLSGTKQFTATATDQGSGVTTVRIEAVSSTGAVTLVCATTSCLYDTKGLASGTYSFRAVASDAVGNVATSAAVGNRVVDNTAPVLTFTDSGTVLTATASDAHSGVKQVTIESLANGTWTAQCTGAASCNVDTTKLAPGSYTFRAVTVDNAGNITTSPTISKTVVDTTPLAGYDVQTINGGVVEKIDNGDSIVYTFNKVVNFTTILGNWTGAPTAVTVELNRAFLFGETSLIDIAGVNLGSIDTGVRFNGNFNNAISFAGTMTAENKVVDGVLRTVVSVRLGRQQSGNAPTGATPATMAWTPTALVKDLAGKPSATTITPEKGSLDADF